MNRFSVVLLVAVVGSLATLVVAHAAPPPAPAAKWEYTCDDVAPGAMTSKAQSRAEQGWELVTTAGFETPKMEIRAYPYNVEVHMSMCFRRHK